MFCMWIYTLLLNCVMHVSAHVNCFCGPDGILFCRQDSYHVLKHMLSMHRVMGRCLHGIGIEGVLTAHL